MLESPNRSRSGRTRRKNLWLTSEWPPRSLAASGETEIRWRLHHRLLSATVHCSQRPYPESNRITKRWSEGTSPPTSLPFRETRIIEEENQTRARGKTWNNTSWIHTFCKFIATPDRSYCRPKTCKGNLRPWQIWKEIVAARLTAAVKQTTKSKTIVATNVFFVKDWLQSSQKRVFWSNSGGIWRTWIKLARVFKKAGYRVWTKIV